MTTDTGDLPRPAEVPEVVDSAQAQRPPAAEQQEAQGERKTGLVLRTLEMQAEMHALQEQIRDRVREATVKSKRLADLVGDRLPVVSDFDESSQVSQREPYERRKRRDVSRRKEAGEEVGEIELINTDRVDRTTRSRQLREGILVSPDGRAVKVNYERYRVIEENENDEGQWEEIGRGESTSGGIHFTDPEDSSRILTIGDQRGPEIEYRETGRLGGFYIDYMGEVRQGYPPMAMERDPIDMAHSGLEYFIEHAAELRLDQPPVEAQPGQAEATPAPIPTPQPQVA